MKLIVRVFFFYKRKLPSIKAKDVIVSAADAGYKKKVKSFPHIVSSQNLYEALSSNKCENEANAGRSVRKEGE